MKKNVAFFVIIALSVLCMPHANAKKYKFPVSSTVPAAISTISVVKDKNTNHSINFKVQHIASPTRLEPARKIFVLWTETSENGVMNLGAVNISKKLSGSLSTATPFTPVRFFLTAEDNAKIIVPNGQVVQSLSL